MPRRVNPRDRLIGHVTASVPRSVIPQQPPADCQQNALVRRGVHQRLQNMTASCAAAARNESALATVSPYCNPSPTPTPSRPLAVLGRPSGVGRRPEGAPGRGGYLGRAGAAPAGGHGGRCDFEHSIRLNWVGGVRSPAKFMNYRHELAPET